jgi:hypothetical protein
MSSPRNYNYCCLFSKGDSCKNHGKTIVMAGQADVAKACQQCGCEMKLLGEAINVVFIGTQESKIKK